MLPEALSGGMHGNAAKPALQCRRFPEPVDGVDGSEKNLLNEIGELLVGTEHVYEHAKDVPA